MIDIVELIAFVYFLSHVIAVVYIGLDTWFEDKGRDRFLLVLLEFILGGIIAGRVLGWW